MRLSIVFLSVSAFCLLISCSEVTDELNPTDNGVIEDVNLGYDSTYAKSLGADDYRMRKYVMAFLKEGPNRDQDSAEVAQIQLAHMNNINEMADKGQLVLAGPFLDDTSIKGIYVFAVETVEEAQKLTETDPAIQKGRLIMELHPWYGSAAMMEITDIHTKISKIEI
jgi:uncharacterized protein YciI